MKNFNPNPNLMDNGDVNGELNGRGFHQHSSSDADYPVMKDFQNNL